MTKLTATATNLHQSLTAASPKGISMSPPAVKDDMTNLYMEKSIRKLETSSLAYVYRSSSSSSTSASATTLSSLIHDSSASETLSSNYQLLTSDWDANSNSNHLGDTANAYKNNVKRRRKPDGKCFVIHIIKLITCF